MTEEGTVGGEDTGDEVTEEGGVSGTTVSMETSVEPIAALDWVSIGVEDGEEERREGLQDSGLVS